VGLGHHPGADDRHPLRRRGRGGLTAAATVWIAAALGIACGLGAWRSVAVAVPIAFALLMAVPWAEEKMMRSRDRPE
jgi:putative Mg2+ transporter-C (MgtC) family protein